MYKRNIYPITITFCLKNTEEVGGIIYPITDVMQVTHPPHSHKYAYQTGYLCAFLDIKGVYDNIIFQSME
jgi:hypothetical protein